MKNLKNNSNLFNYWLDRSTSLIGIVGISTLIALPVLSQSNYPPMVFFQPTAYPNYPQRNAKADLINSLESEPNFKNLLAEVEAAGLTQKLKQGQFTLLAPNDRAFDALSDKAFDKFSEPNNRLKVLQHHLIAGKVTEEDINSGTITNLAGGKIVVSKNNDALKLNQAQVTSPSIAATNGVVIEIDQVLLPPWL